jgi:Fe-S oxidoreductase
MGLSALNTGWIKAGIEIAEKCTECGECITRCPYGLPIPDLIKENIKWVKEQVVLA